jgi:hypothetical protein
MLIVALAGCTDNSPSALSSGSASPSPSLIAEPSSPAPASSPSSAPAATATTTSGALADFDGIQLVKSGGITGITENTSIKPDGTWNRTTSKGVEKTGKLGAADLAELAGLAADPRVKTEADRKSPTRVNCADTFHYLLVVDYQLINYDACPSSADQPPLTKQIIALVQDITD